MSEEGFPPPLRRFVQLFNRGRYWKSHEALEDAWREHESAFYHGLILYASAFVHVERDNPHGIRAQMEKAVAALSAVSPTYLGVDVAGLRRHARSVSETVTRLEDDPPARWSDRITAPLLTLNPGRTSGTEAERAPAPER